MLVHRRFDGLDAPTCFSVGMFDGVHIGHREILRTLRTEAASRDAVPSVLTFSNHPLGVLRPDNPLPLQLTTPEHKTRLLERHGAGLTLLLPFTAELAAMEAEDLLRILRNSYRCSLLVLGEDGKIGKGGTGGTELREKAADAGMETVFIERVSLLEKPVSSSAVRDAVYRSDLGEAARLLGRYFGTLGTVIRGKQQGRRLGFPTLNLNCHREARPPFGVYAGWILLENEPPLPAAVNVGIRPTFTSGRPKDFLIEAFAIDASLPELYGREVEVLYAAKIRDERFFPSPEMLSSQIRKDVSECLRALRRLPPPVPGDYAIDFR